VAKLVDIIVKRSAEGKNYGIVLIPEGLIEFIPQMNTLITQINKIVAGINSSDSE
jgi:pyrophosphate--fructose-6-phosphate 1-phosphotransferase